ncbi:MAG: hypothetical protein ACE5HF_04810 [Gemmatimonadota bacterium]
MLRRIAPIALGSLLLAAAHPRGLAAQARFGAQLDIGDDQDLGLGGRVVLGLVEPKGFDFVGSFDWFFPDEPPGVDVTYWEINGNLIYSLDLPAVPSVGPYIGGGINIAHRNREFSNGTDASDTDAGLNLLGGATLDTRSVTPFLELRLEIEGGDQFVVAGGVLF